MSQQPLPHHSSGDPLNEMFLSPRVIDRTAFEEFAAKLNDLISNVQRGETSLNQASANAGEVEASLQQAGIELELKAERVADLIPSLDERLQQIETILHETMSKVADPAHVRGHVNRLIAGKLESLDAEVGDLFSQAKERIQHAESNALKLVKEDPDRVVELEHRLTAIETRLSTLDQQSDRPNPTEIASLNAQANEARDMLAMAILSASARVDELSEQSEEVITILDTCLSHTKEEASKITSQRDACENSAREAIDRLEDIASDASQRLSMMLASLTEKEVAARDLAHELGELITAMHALRTAENDVNQAPPDLRKAA